MSAKEAPLDDPARAPCLQLALVGGGMFGGDVVLRTIEDLERCGVAPYLGRLGLDGKARDLAGVHFALKAIGTRTPATATALCARYTERLAAAGGPPAGGGPRPYHGAAPWNDILAEHDIDILFVATPDSLHYEPAMSAIERGVHVMVEKPLSLRLTEADEIRRRARERGVIVGVDMHKRYDPAHRFIFGELLPQLGKPLYGRAVLEEPLAVSTEIFQWAATSNPFSYVGCHWVDLFGHYLDLRPRSLHAVGQKELLARWSHERPGDGSATDIDTFDAMQVAIDYTGGLRIYYVNNWINPKEFEGAVNQELELVGTRGKVEFDQQYRGLRATISGVGSKTFNPHFTRDLRREGGAPPAFDGYGKDSIIDIVTRATEVRLGRASRADLAGRYPDVESARPTVAIVEAADVVARRNLAHLRRGAGTPVTARFSEEGIEIVDPLADNDWLYRGNPWE